MSEVAGSQVSIGTRGTLIWNFSQTRTLNVVSLGFYSFSPTIYLENWRASPCRVRR